MELVEQIAAYLESHHVLTLATVDEAGPWAAPLFYASDRSLALYFLSDPATRHRRAIARSPRVSAAVYGGTAVWTEITGVQIDGWARAVDDEERDHAFGRYAAKFPFALALIPPDGPYRIYQIRPRWVRLIDNARGLGFKEEICLERSPA